MLVRLHQTVYVTEHFQLGRFGQVVVSSGARLRQPTADIRATDQAAVQAAQHANDLNHLIIDDADQAQNPDPIVFGRGGQPLSAANTLRGGDSLTDAVGVLTYTWAGNAASGNAYRLRPVGALGGSAAFQPANPRPTVPPDVGTARIKIASANLLNFFNTFTGCRFGTAGAPTDCRGANDDTEYQRQLAKEVASLRFLDADVIGYMEMENDGYGPDQRRAGARRRPQRRRRPGIVGVHRPGRRARSRRRRRDRCHQGRRAVPDRIGLAGRRRDVRRPERPVRAPTGRPDLRDARPGPGSP